MARIGLKGLTYATISTGGEGSAVVYTGGATKGDMMMRADVTLNHEDVKMFADNHAVERANGVIGGTIALELAKLPNDVKEALLGYTANGNVLTVTEDPAPYVGFGYYRILLVDNTKIYEAFWYHKVQFALQDENASTKKEQIEWGTYHIQGTGFGVELDSSGTVHMWDRMQFSTEAAAKAWIKTRAGIT